jgi:hypothetical protein
MVVDLACQLVITNSDAALAAKAFGPEALNGRRRACHAVVGKEEPEAEDGLDKNVENGISNDFGIDISNA